MSHMVIESLVPIFVMLGMFALIFGVVYIRSRENMALIDRGINPRQHKPTGRPFATLKYGLLTVGSGLGLISALFIDMAVMMHDERAPVIYFALIAIGGGLGLILSYRIEKKHLDKHNEE